MGKFDIWMEGWPTPYGQPNNPPKLIATDVEANHFIGAVNRFSITPEAGQYGAYNQGLLMFDGLRCFPTRQAANQE